MQASPSPRALQGMHAVVTGGSRGIGAAIASALAEQGATLTLMGRDRSRLDAKAAQLAQRTQVGGITVDVANAQSVSDAFALAQTERGPVQILINNAGLAASAPFVRTEPELWAHMLEVNLTGT